MFTRERPGSEGISRLRKVRKQELYCVAMGPGLTVFTWIPWEASSNAMFRARWINAALVVPYSAFSSEATEPCWLAMWMIRPPPWARIAGSTAWLAKNAAARLTSTTAAKSSRENAPNAFRQRIPALFTSTSTRPNTDNAAATMASACPATDRS